MIHLLFSDEPSQRWIGVLTRNWVSHVDVIATDGRLIGARPIGGVLSRPPGYHKFTRQLQVDIPTDAHAFNAFIAAQIGKPYDWRSIVSFFFRREWQDEDSWTCAELVAAGLVVAGYFRPPYIASSKISPADLLLMLSSRVDIKERTI